MKITKQNLLDLVGSEVFIYLFDDEKPIHGTLGYVYQFSPKYGYRKPNYFYIGNISFRVSHVRRVVCV